jgi:hypothetical protein
LLETPEGKRSYQAVECSAPETAPGQVLLKDRSEMSDCGCP